MLRQGGARGRAGLGIRLGGAWHGMARPGGARQGKEEGAKALQHVPAPELGVYDW